MLIISLILWARELGTRPTLFLYKFYWIVVGLQCCVSFRCTIKWFNFIYTYIHAFSDSFSIEVITEYCGEFFRLVVCLIYTRWVGPDGWNGIKQWSEPSILALAKLLNEPGLNFQAHFAFLFPVQLVGWRFPLLSPRRSCWFPLNVLCRRTGCHLVSLAGSWRRAAVLIRVHPYITGRLSPASLF